MSINTEVQQNHHLEELLDRNPIKMFPHGKFREAVEALPFEILLMTEEDIRGKCPGINSYDQEIRRNYWLAISECEKTGRALTTAELFKGVVTHGTFYMKIVPNPYRVAWITRPIVDYKAFCEAIFRFGLDNLGEFIRTTRVTTENSTRYLKVLEFFANRSVGTVTQRIESKIESRNLNVEMRSTELPPGGDNLDISARLEQAKARFLEAPRDVGPTENEG